MDFNLLPNELLNKIVSYLDIYSAKQISLTSKRMHKFAISRLWAKPEWFQAKDMDFLEKISNFPIQELTTWNFIDCSWLEILALVPQLKLLIINSSGADRTPQESQLRHLKRLPLVIHTISFKMIHNEDIVQLCQIMETLNVHRLIIDHCSYAQTLFRWSFSQFKMFIGKFPIYEITTDCFDLNESNVVEFIHIVAGIENCRVLIRRTMVSDAARYCFTLKDIELMIKLDIKVTGIETNSIKTDCNIEIFLGFADLFRKIKHLEDFIFSFEDFEKDNLPPMEKLTDIPIKRITSRNFKIQKYFPK